MSSSQRPTHHSRHPSLFRSRFALYALFLVTLFLLCLSAFCRFALLHETQGGTKENAGTNSETLLGLELPLFSRLGQEACWSILPERVRGEKGPLPLWARTLARSLPQTTAAMLELDYLHRAGGALSAKLQGTIRWAGARANRSPYGEAVAIADLRAAGLGDDYIAALTGDPSGWPADLRTVIRFAFALTRAPHEVTDAEVTQLAAQYGEKELVAIVLLLAHSNFQDRLVLALN